MKIDIHTHIMPEHMPHWTKKFGYGEFIHLEHRNCEACMIRGEKFFRKVEENCFRADIRIKEMDDTEVTMQVLSTIPVLFNYWAKPEDGLETSIFFNDHIAETVEKKPDRFVGLGTVPLQDVDLAIKEMERCVKELKFPGLEIGSNINGENLSEEKYFPFYQAAEELGCALFIHPWEMMGENQMQKYWLPWLVGMPAETARAICSMIFGGVFRKISKAYELHLPMVVDHFHLLSAGLNMALKFAPTSLRLTIQSTPVNIWVNFGLTVWYTTKAL